MTVSRPVAPRPVIWHYYDITPDTGSKTIQVQLCVLVHVVFMTMFTPIKSLILWSMEQQ